MSLPHTEIRIADHDPVSIAFEGVSAPQVDQILSISGFERFVEKQRPLLEQSLAHACGGTKLVDTLAYGSSRRSDSLIVQTLAAKEARRSKTPVTCLELGCGTTYCLHEDGHESDYGGPWLSRYIAHVCPESVDLLASDITNSLQIIARKGEEVFIVTPRYRLNPSEAPLSQIIDGEENLRFKPLSYKELVGIRRSWERKYPRAFHNPFRQLQERLSVKNLRGIEVYIRPELDAEVERKLFQLDVRTGVDSSALSKSFRKSFDFIFARHQEPVSVGWRKRISKSVQRRLSYSGSAILEYEQAGRSRMFKVSPRRRSN